MRPFLNRPRSSTFSRLLIACMLPMLLVLLVLLGYLYYRVNQDISEKVLDSQINRLNRIAYQNEVYVSSMLNSAEQIGLSPFIEPFSFDEEPHKAYELMQQLAPYMVSNYFCNQMYVAFAGDDHLYSAKESMRLDMFMDITRFERLTKEQLKELLQISDRITILPAQHVESILLTGGQTSMVTFVIPLGISSRSHKGSMLFLVPESEYAALFADAIEVPNNTYILRGGKALAASGDLEIPFEVVASYIRPDEEQTGIRFSWNGETWELLTLGKRGWDMVYATVIRASDLRTSVWRSMLEVLMLIAAVAVVGLTAALLAARHSIRPIHGITRMLPESHEQTGDELVRIQSGIRQLADSNMDLASRLEQSIPMQRHGFVLRFMKGRYVTREEALMAAASVGLNIDLPYYAVIQSRVLDSDEGPLDLRQPPFDAIPCTLGQGIEMIALKTHLYLVFSEQPDHIRQMAELIRSEIVERSGNAIVALSAIQTDFLKAPSAYLEAATAYDNRFVMDGNRLLDYASLSMNIEGILPQAHKITEGINQALLVGSREMLDGKLADLRRFLQHTSMSPFAFRMIYNNVIDALLREHASELSVGRDALEIYNIFSLTSCQSLDDLNNLLQRLCDTIMTAETAHDDPAADEKGDPVIDQVVSYMRDHYTVPDLSISAIAEAFEMPMTRLSLAFKEVMRMTPLEYLTLLRVERSKELLSATDMSIKDLAASVGYYDSSSFIRRFKQMTGVTPLQYRRSKEEEKHGEHTEG